MLIHISITRFMLNKLLGLSKRLHALAKVRVNRAGQGLVIPISVDGGLDHIYWTKSWKTELIERLVNKDGGAFIDVGANIGQTLLDLRTVHAEVQYMGFEPNSTCIVYLKRLILANGFSNCLIVPVGLADENRILSFYRLKDAPTDSCGTILSELRPDRLYDIDFVASFRFDDIRNSLIKRSIGFVKVDVEGAELETLSGMRTSIEESRPPILCEVLFTDSKADLSTQKLRNDQLVQLLTDLNYMVLQLIKSSDNAHVVDAKQIQNFHSTYWTSENQDLCDYLFIPKEKVAHVLNALLPVRDSGCGQSS